MQSLIAVATSQVCNNDLRLTAITLDSADVECCRRQRPFYRTMLLSDLLRLTI